MKRANLAAAAVISVAMGVASAVADSASLRLETTEVRVRYQAAELGSPVAARMLLKRIGNAALESCGASSFSLNEFRVATEHSECWKNAVAEAVRDIDSPALNAVAAGGGR
jgi:UrcA family protein